MVLIRSRLRSGRTLYCGPRSQSIRICCTFVVVCLILTATRLITEDTASEKEKSAASEQTPPADQPKMAELKVVLRDENGQPIPGATLLPYGMRLEGKTGHYSWGAKKYGPPKEALSNQEGVAVVQYPASVNGQREVYKLSHVSFRVEHPEFVQKAVHFNLGPPQADVTLQAGCEVHFSAVDDSGTAISPFSVLMAGPYATDRWVSDGKNGLRTRAIKDGTWQTMLVSIPKSGPALFSRVMPFTIKPKQTFRMQNVRLSSGARLRGTLAANVPRPVTNGRLISTTVPRPAGASFAEKDPSIMWHECTGIDAEGSFELPSLPRDGEIQIIALCDGWLSKTTGKDADRSLIAGQIFPVDSLDVEVTVDMEQTGTLEVIVKKPDGSPLEGASVSTWPNQVYYKGGSTFLGQETNSRDRAIQQLLPREERVRSAFLLTNRFSIKTDSKGRATFAGLPLRHREQLTIFHSEYALPVGPRNERNVDYILLNPDVKHLELVAVKSSAPDMEKK